MNIETATALDEAAIKRLLQIGALPIEDLAWPMLQHFLVLRAAVGIDGVVGLDVRGQAAMLRSLAVAPAQRGRGVGGRLVNAAEILATGLGIGELYLLTTTAQDYFARRGYCPVQRNSVPDDIRRLPQFAALCPASAVLMSKQLGGAS